jgi:hypothetical protein
MAKQLIITLKDDEFDNLRRLAELLGDPDDVLSVAAGLLAGSAKTSLAMMESNADLQAELSKLTAQFYGTRTSLKH